jgi:hypothetical protein
MSQVSVEVYCDGRRIKTIERPLRVEGGEPAVVYKGKVYRIQKGGEIHVGRTLRPIADAPVPPRPAVRTPTATRSRHCQRQRNVIEWDDDQRNVIAAASSARLIVDAGPGTGKTEVACARVASLIAQGTEPANIWLLSFTRTAIQEIRNRIAALVTNEASAAAVRITTLDSHAWHLVQGFETDGDHVFGTYDDTIAHAISLLRAGSEEVNEYLARLEHVIVDEAQDLVGLRADLVETLLEKLARECGATVFSDEAQAIYGFSETASGPPGSIPLPGRVRAKPSLGFSWVSLGTVHRTDSTTLREIFTSTRRMVLDPREGGLSKLRSVRADIEIHHDGAVGDILDQNLAGRDDVLVLYRQRADVLSASAYLWQQGVSHRIRMSGLPRCLPPWIAAFLWDFEAPHLDRREFEARYSRRAATIAALPSVEELWSRLTRVAGARADRVDMPRLRARLSSSQPPIGLYSPDIGSSGPLIGTIHASKGREAPEVHLMLPPMMEEDDQGNVDEEVRVVFVGATRAQQSLRIGHAKALFASSLAESGRCYRHLRRSLPGAQVEFGRDDDVDTTRQVSSTLYSSSSEAVSSQETLLSGRYPLSVTAESNRADEYVYRLFAEIGASRQIIGALVPSINSDLFRIADACYEGRKLKPPPQIRHLYCVGVRTVALESDSPHLAALHAPYCDSGFFLAPIVIGFSTVPFFPSRKR